MQHRVFIAAFLIAPPVAHAQPPTGAAKPAQASPARQELAPFSQEIPTAAYKVEMLPVPGSPDGAIKPFYMSKAELGWEAFDVFIYRLDEEAGKGPKNADAVSRPSKPYLPPDRGFGHEGYAAISMSAHNAAEFCKWLSAQTGLRYRLPTEQEWELAASLDGKGTRSDKATGTCIPEGKTIDDAAWHAGNASESPHPTGKKSPNALGFVDMLGNVAEWVVDKDSKHVTKGGSFKDGAEALRVSARQPQDAAWNVSDPQVPKSKWWLSDGPHVGFRIVCETSGVSKVSDPAPSRTPPTMPAGAAKPNQERTQ